MLRSAEILSEILSQDPQQIAVHKQLIASRIGHQNHLQIRKNQHVLSEHPVKRIAAGTLLHPDLISVSIFSHSFIRHRMNRCGTFHPSLRKHPFSFPDTILKIQLPQLRRIFRTQEQSPAAFCDPRRTALPENMLNSQRFPQARG